MNQQEAAALLGIAAAFDNRKPDADAAKAWSVTLDGYRFTDVRDVIVAHYRDTDTWLMPSHIIAAVKRLRAKRLHDAGDPTPPPDLTPLETIAWLRDWRSKVGDGDTPESAYGELTPRHMPDLLRLMPAPDQTETAATEETA